MKRPTNTYTDGFGQTIEFHIPYRVHKICINISGGADSAILLYMLIQYCEAHVPNAQIHIITCANPVKGWYNAIWASRVIDRVLALTKTTLIKSHYTYFSDDQRRSELDDAEKVMHTVNNLRFTIHGTTQNPPLDVEELKEGRHEPRDEGHGRHRIQKSRLSKTVSTKLGTTTMVKNTQSITRWMPLMDVDKRMVAYLYTHFNMLEALFPYTRSCEWEEALMAAGTLVPNPGDGHCGECWWCKEREWAFGRL